MFNLVIMKFKELLKEFASKIWCNHGVTTFVSYAETTVHYDGSVKSIVRCNKCKKYLSAGHKPAHIVRGIMLDEKKRGHVIVVLDNDNKISLSVKLLIENVSTGLWFVSLDALKHSLSFLFDKVVAFPESDKTGGDQDVIQFGYYAQWLERLKSGSKVVIPLSDGKIFLMMLSSHYGYENARKRWQWERDDNKQLMTFKAREKRR